MSGGWYKPRFLGEIKFAGSKEIGDLPKPTDPLFTVTTATTDNVIPAAEPLDLGHYSHQKPFTSRIISSSLLSQEDPSKRVYSVRLDVSQLTHWNWMPGDAFGILPENDGEVVGFALQRLGLDPNQLLRLEVVGKPTKESLAEFWSEYDRPVQIRDLFTKYLDLTYFPKKACLLQLASCCTDEHDKLDLLYLASRTGSADYLRVAGERTTILDFLHTFRSCRPDLELLLRHLPLLHPRFYSISNTPLDATHSIEFIFNTIEYNTPDGLLRRGLCSSWLEKSIQDGTPVKLVPRANSTVFRPPQDESTPIVMISAGTGLAPFIGFLRHFSAAKQKVDSWLFYGFKNVGQDFLFRAELEVYTKDGTLGRLSIAVSRQPELGHPKYVQHALALNEDEIWAKLAVCNKTKIYICGDELTMVKEVNDFFVKMVAEHMDLSSKEATLVVQQWNKDGRIVRDIWI